MDKRWLIALAALYIIGAAWLIHSVMFGGDVQCSNIYPC